MPRLIQLSFLYSLINEFGKLQQLSPKKNRRATSQMMNFLEKILQWLIKENQLLIEQNVVMKLLKTIYVFQIGISSLNQVIEIRTCFVFKSREQFQ